MWKWIVFTALGAGGMFFSNWLRRGRVQELSLEGLASITIPGNFSLKPGVWNYTAWATGSSFGQTPLAETHDPDKISFCLPNGLRTDIGGNTRHDGYLLITLFRQPQEPFDPLHYNRVLLPTESYWAPGFKLLTQAGDLRLFKAEGSWPAFIAYDPHRKIAAFLLAPKYTLDEACQLLSRVVSSIRIDDARLESYFEKADSYPQTRSEKVSANLRESRANLARDNWPMPGESTELRKVWYTDDGRLHLRERMLSVPSEEGKWLRNKLHERNQDGELEFEVDGDSLSIYFEFSTPLHAVPWDVRQRELRDRRAKEVLEQINVLRPYYNRSKPTAVRPREFLPGFERSAVPPFFPIENQGGWKGYIDRSGRVILNTGLVEAQMYAEGLAWIRGGALWSAIAEDGSYQVHLPFEDVNEAWPFSSGWARFARGTSYWHDGGPRGEDWAEFAGTYQFVRRDGTILDRAFEWAGDFINGFAKVRAGGRDFWLDAGGLPVNAPRECPEPELLQPFLYSGAKPLYGYRNASGEVVIEPQFVFAQPFSEGLAAVRDESRWGYIDGKGSWIISPRYMDASPFHNGLARVRSGKALAYCDRAGNYVWKQTLG